MLFEYVITFHNKFYFKPMHMESLLLGNLTVILGVRLWGCLPIIAHTLSPPTYWLMTFFRLDDMPARGNSFLSFFSLLYPSLNMHKVNIHPILPHVFLFLFLLPWSTLLWTLIRQISVCHPYSLLLWRYPSRCYLWIHKELPLKWLSMACEGCFKK